MKKELIIRHLKIRITVFFSIIFIATIAIPTIIGLSNKNTDVSVYLNLEENEQEKEKGDELNLKEIKKITSNYTTSNFSNNDKKEKCMIFYTKIYISQYPIILTEPPEFLL